MNVDIHRIRCGIANCYLLKGDGGAILVDATNPGNEAEIVKQMQQQGIQPGDLKLIFITHGHMDHFGSADRLKFLYGVPTAMHTADARPMPSIRSKGLIGRLMLAASRPAIYKQPIFQPDINLVDGMRLDEYGVGGAVLHLPGHSAGSTGILLDDGRLIAGDMYMNILRPGPAHIFEDYGQLTASDSKIKSHGVSVVYPGHGKAFKL